MRWLVMASKIGLRRWAVGVCLVAVFVPVIPRPRAAPYWLFGSLNGSGQRRGFGEGTQGSANRAEIDRFADQGNQALYDLDFCTAYDRLQRMADSGPDSPKPFVYLATCIWARHLE